MRVPLILGSAYFVADGTAAALAALCLQRCKELLCHGVNHLRAHRVAHLHVGLATAQLESLRKSLRSARKTWSAGVWPEAERYE